MRAGVAIAQGEPEQADATPTTRSRLPPSHRRIGAFPTPSNASHSGRRRRQSPRSSAALRRGRRHPAAHGRGPVQGLGRRLRSLGRGVARCFGREDFDAAWAEGAALSTEEAIAYAQRGRGERKRPTSGWASLTPTERDVVAWSAKDWPTTTSPRGFSSHRAPCKPTSPTSTPNSASPPACSSSKKQPATPDPAQQ